MDDSVYLLFADEVLLGVYRDAMLADKDMVLCRQGDMHAGRPPLKYYVRRMSVITGV